MSCQKHCFFLLIVVGCHNISARCHTLIFYVWIYVPPSHLLSLLFLKHGCYLGKLPGYINICQSIFSDQFLHCIYILMSNLASSPLLTLTHTQKRTTVSERSYRVLRSACKCTDCGTSAHI